MYMHKGIIASLMLCIALSAAPVSIITTTTDLASIAKSIAGGFATVESIASGHEDPHDLSVRPSFITKAAQADLWIRVGLELEIGWEPPVLRDSHNRRIQIGAPGHLDVSAGIRRLDVPEGNVSRADGDIHPSGNPHYWLDPLNGRMIAKAIETRLSQLFPDSQSLFQSNLRKFESALDGKMFGEVLVAKVGGAKLWWLCETGKLDEYLQQNNLAADKGSWLASMIPFRHAKIATYHRSWIYLMDRFALDLAATIEPKPGIPPSAKHIAKITKEFQKDGVKVILQEPFYSDKAAQRIAKACGAKIVIRANCTNGAEGVNDYITMLDKVVGGIAEAFTSAE